MTSTQPMTAHLAVQGEVGEVHGAGGLHGEPHAALDLAGVGDPQELVLLRGGVEVSRLLVDEEGVRHPDLLDVVRRHHDRVLHAVLKIFMICVI